MIYSKVNRFIVIEFMIKLKGIPITKITIKTQLLLGHLPGISLPPSTQRAFQIGTTNLDLLDNLEEIVHQFQEQLKNCHRIILVTGFPSNDFFETDGLIGVLFLADFLLNFEKPLEIICEQKLSQILNQIYLKIFTKKDKISFKPIEIYRNYDKALLITIERPGKNLKGISHNMKGEKISNRLYDIEPIIRANPPKFWIAVGDGGNELGLGKFRSIVHKKILNAYPCQCGCDGGIGVKEEADLVLLGATSNYATIGFIFELSHQTHIPKNYSWKKYQNILHLLNSYNIYDGVNGAKNSVDGMDIELLKQIYLVLEEFYNQQF